MLQYIRVSEIKPDKCDKTPDGWIVDNLVSNNFKPSWVDVPRERGLRHDQA